jgi:hypothetical protein
VKGIERRSNHKFKDIMSNSLTHVISCSESLAKLLKFTPPWRSDHSSLTSAIEQVRCVSVNAAGAFAEARRRVTLLDEERKSRKCPPLIDGQRRLIGIWPLTEEKIFVPLFSDVVFTVQQRVEILSRKKYFIISRRIQLSQVMVVQREKAGVELMMRGASDLILMISLKGDELLDALKANLPKC